MIQLTAYGERVVDRLNMMGMWLAVVVCIRNFCVCFGQYKRTRGKIHLLNLGQVTVFLIHRFLYGIIPLFEVSTCAYFPLLVSLWHITYILFYVVMFMRLIILESDRHSLWIKIVGIILIAIRFADWPYELAFQSIQQDIMSQKVAEGATCWATWGNGVIILNFVGDALANLFLSGMFVRRLYLHIRMSKSIISRQNQLIEYIARKSLICLILTFVVNLAMNLLKVTMFIGDRSDAYTVYFELIESTLLVEALRVDYTKIQQQAICENCGMAVNVDYNGENSTERSKRKSFDVFRRNSKRLSDATAGSSRNFVMQNMNDPHYQDNILRTIALFDSSKPECVSEDSRETMSAPAFALRDKPLTTTNSNAASSTIDIPAQPPAAAATAATNRRKPLSQRPEWQNNDYRMF